MARHIETHKAAQDPIHKYKDPIREYDYKKINDPLEQPVRRLPRHLIHPPIFKQIIDLPTRGYPDNFKLMGYLVCETDPDARQGFLRLYGRQLYPGSSQYEYYTIIDGAENIKIPIKTAKKYQELRSDDVITISEVSKNYKVTIYDYDAPKYYPHILF